MSKHRPGQVNKQAAMETKHTDMGMLKRLIRCSCVPCMLCSLSQKAYVCVGQAATEICLDQICYNMTYFAQLTLDPHAS